MAPKKKSDKASAPLIKGYLPVRLKLPSGDETFFYVREHQTTNANNKDSSSSSKPTSTTRRKSDTLFVVNAPVVPPVPTKTLLHALLGRYGNVTRVTVVDNPRNGFSSDQHQEGSSPTTSSSSSMIVWTDQFAPPSFLPSSCDLNHGKFAHVVFESHSEMKRVYRALADAMKDDPRDDDDGLPGIVVDKNELQMLAPSDDTESSEKVTISKESRVATVAQRYQRQYRELSSSRAALLEECNRVMREFEHDEESERLAREATSNEPDEDGFITVGYNNTASSVAVPKGSSKRQLDEDATGRRKSGQKRKRKKKQHGASELDDFYRFQTKMERKRTLQELRQSFEEDLAKIQKMKEQRQCLPF